MTDQQIVGEHLVATLSDKNYYTRTLNKIFITKSDMKPMYNLTLDYDIPEKTFSMTLDKESLKGLADFINNYLEKNNDFLQN
jgi:hypothetical protein